MAGLGRNFFVEPGLGFLKSPVLPVNIVAAWLVLLRAPLPCLRLEELAADFPSSLSRCIVSIRVSRRLMCFLWRRMTAGPLGHDLLPHRVGRPTRPTRAAKRWSERTPSSIGSSLRYGM